MAAKTHTLPETRADAGGQALLKSPPTRLHHRATVVRDQEINRQFFEDLLGIPLVATWCERNFSPPLGQDIEMCHTFYALKDGSALAFFQFADPAVRDRCVPPKAAEVKAFDHTAIKIDEAGFKEVKGRLEKAGVEHRATDHGYCRSIYATSPDGFVIEFTTDPENVEEIDAWQRSIAHKELKRWLAGDHSTNNNHRPKGAAK